MTGPVSNSNNVPDPSWDANINDPTASASASVSQGGVSELDVELQDELDPNSSINIKANDLRRGLRALSHSHGGVEPPPPNLDVSQNVQSK